MDPGPPTMRRFWLCERNENHSAGVLRPCRAPGGDLEGESGAKAIRDFRDYNYQFRDSCREQESATMANIFNNYDVILTSV